MLGLSSGVSTAAKPDRILKSEFYTFESSVSPWTAHSVQGTLTMQAGQSAPGSSDSDWMKCTYDTTQDAGSSGIRVTNWALEPTPIAAGDVATVICDLHVVNDSGKWDPEGDSDAVDFRAQTGSGSATTDIALDTTSLNHTFTVTATGTSANLIIEVQAMDDRPQAGAVFYIRNIRATLKRP